MLWWLKTPAKVCNLCMMEKAPDSFNRTGLDVFECGGHPDTNVCKSCLNGWKAERRKDDLLVNCPICRSGPQHYRSLIHAILKKPALT